MIKVFLLFASLIAGTLQIYPQQTQAQADSILENRRFWTFYAEEFKINRLLHGLSRDHQPQTSAYVNVALISMEDSALVPGQTVIIENGRISAIGAAGEVAIPAEALRIDGHGKFLMPGLTDMHVHTQNSNGQKLLNLANGVTTVRELCGFDWMLDLRELISESKLLAPNLYLSGKILNHSSMGRWAIVIKTPEHGRETVRKQKEQGFDFIKVHNIMPPEIYLAIADEARLQQIDLVGHIPHHMKIATALAAGQKTFEHFKGYILDHNLEMTDENYVEVSRGADVWHCPTMINSLASAEMGVAEDAILPNRPELRYVSSFRKELWLRLAQRRRVNRVRQVKLAREIFPNLLAINARFIAGTDCGGGNENMVPGFALRRELQIMQSAGMTPYQAIQAGTVNAAAAMSRTSEFGTVSPGKRADLLLLDKNPLETVENLSEISGVMVRGTWLTRAVIDAYLEQIADIYAADLISDNPVEAVDALVADIHWLHHQQFPLRENRLNHIGYLLMGLDRFTEAIEILRINVDRFPDSYNAFDSLGEAYLKNGDLQLASSSFRKSLALNSGNDNARKMIATIKQRLSKEE